MYLEAWSYMYEHRGLNLWFFSDLGQGKRNVCFEMTNVRLFLKGFEKMLKPSIIICFFKNKFGQNFHFFMDLYFLDFFGWNWR